MTRRNFAEHTELLTAFAAHVEALSPEAWQRLRINCRPLAGSTPQALLVRAELMATANAYDALPIPRDASFVRAITGLGHAAILGIGLTFEVLTSAFPPTAGLPRPRTSSVGKPEFDQHIDATYVIEHALDRNGVRIPSVTAAVRAAAQAITHHDHMAPETFQRVYQWVESEIPYSTVDPTVADAQYTGD